MTFPTAGLGAFTLPGSYPFPVPTEVLCFGAVTTRYLQCKRLATAS